MYPVRILSIDGGGIRGIIPLKVLEYIENNLEKNTDKSIHQLFNIFGGTSTGGIIALGLNTLNPDTKKVYTAKELIKFYTEDADKIFYSWNKGSGSGYFSSQYDPKHIEDYLKIKFGEHTSLHQLPTTSDCDVTVYSYDLIKNEPFYFNNRDRGVEALVWQAARATSAAPTYFPAFKFEDGIIGLRLLTDGGVYINNPVLNLLIRARRLYPNIKKQSQLIVSLGTGQFSPSLERLENAGIVGFPDIPDISKVISLDIVNKLKEIVQEAVMNKNTINDIIVFRRSFRKMCLWMARQQIKFNVSYS